METFDELERSLRTVTVDTETLVRSAVRGGRRLQHRRRAGVTAGVVALGAAVAVAQAATPGSATHTTSIATDPSTAPTQTAGDSGLPTPEQTDARLVALLPTPGTLVEADSNKKDSVTVVRDIDPDGSGQGEVGVFLSLDDPMGPSQVAGADQKCSLVASTSTGDGCVKLSDGWMFTYNFDKDPTQGPPRRFMWGATTVYEDGTSVAVQATNYVDDGQPDRQAPVLDADQVKALASDPVWFKP
jgi:hypothetical protein